MSVVAVILARSGSKRIKHKNMLPFFGESLLVRQYRLASESPCIDNIVVFTDSLDYLSAIEPCEKYIDIGIRPASLSTDLVTDLECFQYIQQLLEKRFDNVELLVHLRPTYPSIQVSDIDEAVSFMKTATHHSLKSVQKTDFKAQKIFTLSEGSLRPLSGNLDSSSLPGQSCDSVYAQTAAIDIYRPAYVKSGSLWGTQVYPYQCGNISADLDVFSDLPSAYADLDVKCALTVIKRNINAGNKPLDGIKVVSDVDGVIFSRVENGDYSQALPIVPVIEFYLDLLAQGVSLSFLTARGSKTGIDWFETTRNQLDQLGFGDCLLCMGKPEADFYVDDRFTGLDVLSRLVASAST